MQLCVVQQHCSVVVPASMLHEAMLFMRASTTYHTCQHTFKPAEHCTSTKYPHPTHTSYAVSCAAPCAGSPRCCAAGDSCCARRRWQILPRQGCAGPSGSHQHRSGGGLLAGAACGLMPSFTAL